MKKILGILSLSLALVFTYQINAYAQKAKPVTIGYVNSALIMQQMPEIKQINEQLNTFQQKYVDQYNTMLKELQDKTASLEADEKNPSISPTIKETKRKELQDLQNRIVSFQQKAQEDLGHEQEKLMQPMRDKVRKAINDLAAKKGLTYVLDSSSGILIVAPEQQDITNEVKKSLNLP